MEVAALEPLQRSQRSVAGGGAVSGGRGDSSSYVDLYVDKLHVIE